MKRKRNRRDVWRECLQCTYQASALGLHHHTVDGCVLDDIARLGQSFGRGHDHVAKSLQDLCDSAVVPV